MTQIEDDGVERVYDEVIGLFSRLTRSGVSNGIVARVVFAIGVKAMLREGDTIEEIQKAIVEVAALKPEGRGQA